MYSALLPMASGPPLNRPKITDTTQLAMLSGKRHRREEEARDGVAGVPATRFPPKSP